MLDRDIELRLSRLEKENHRLRMLGGALALGLLAILLMGQAGEKPKTVQAEVFEVIGRDGSVRARLSATASAHVGLSLLGRNGQVRGRFGVRRDDSCALSLHSPDGGPGIDLLTPRGTPSIVLYDGDKRPRTSLVVGPAGDPQLTCRDLDGKVRLSLNLEAKGHAHLCFYDATGKAHEVR